MKIKTLAISLIIIISSITIVNIVYGQSVVGNIGDTCASEKGCTPCDFVRIFVNASNIIVGLSGTFSILMFIYGGVVMLTAYGNENRITWGKNILIATVIGIGIVLLSWTFVNLIIEAFFGGSNLPIGPWQNVGGQCGTQAEVGEGFDFDSF